MDSLSPHPDPTSARRVDDRFELGDLLGAGSYGAVYQAWDGVRAEHVAIKTLTRMDAAALYRFKREFRSLSDHVHPHLVRLYELFCEQGQWFFSMELLQGEDFFNYVRPEARELEREGLPYAPMTKAADSRLRQVLIQLIDGLGFLHQAGLLHRDLKPANVRITPKGRSVLLDFGLVGDWDTTGPHTLFSKKAVGTLEYMAPEQAVGTASQPAADWYALGVMLYEVLCGRRPFEGQPRAMLGAKLIKRPQDPRVHLPGIADDLSELALQLLELDVDDRPKEPEIRDMLGLSRPSAKRDVLRASGHFARNVPLEREEQYVEMRKAVRYLVGHNSPSLVTIEGSAGFGKSTFLQHFVERQGRAKRALTLTGRCYANEAVPYKGFDSLIDSLVRYLCSLPESVRERLLPEGMDELSQVFPTLRHAMPGEGKRPLPQLTLDLGLRSRAFATLRSLLTRCARQSPLVLTIDDFHWADLDSLDLLAELLTSRHPPPVLIVIAYDPGMGIGDRISDSLLPQIFAQRVVQHTHLPLKPLSLEACQTWAKRLGFDVAASDFTRLYQQSGGIPGKVQQLLSEKAGNRRRTSRPRNILNLEYLEGQLSPEAIEVLTWISLIGRPVRRSVLTENLRVRCSDEVLNELDHYGAVVVSNERREERLQVHNRPLAQGMLERVDATELRKMHSRYASALRRQPKLNPLELASHLQSAHQFAAAQQALVDGGKRCVQRGAYRQASQLFNQALALKAMPIDESLAYQIAQAHAKAGFSKKAALAYRQAASLAPDGRAGLYHWHAAESLLHGGYFHEARESLDKALARVGTRLPTTPRQAQLTVLARRLQARWSRLPRATDCGVLPDGEPRRKLEVLWSTAVARSTVDSMRGAAIQAEHCAQAQKMKDSVHLACACAAEVAFERVQGVKRAARVNKLLNLAQELARTSQDAYAKGMLAYARAFEGLTTGGWPGYLQHCQGAESALAQATRDCSIERSQLRIESLRALSWMGRFAEGGPELLAVRRDAGRRGDLYLSTRAAVEIAPFYALASGRVGDQAARIRDALAGWQPGAYTLQHFYGFHHEVQLALYQEDIDRAERLLDSSLPPLVEAGLTAMYFVAAWCAELRARVLLSRHWPQSGPSKEAVRTIETAIRELKQCHVGWPRALARALEAGLALRLGQPAQAAHGFQLAQTELEQVGMAMFAAGCERAHRKLCGERQVVAPERPLHDRLRAAGVFDPERLMQTYVPLP